jgi:formylmethanofuran dehydrogenase subunit B
VAESLTCAGCGLLCDDVTVAGGRFEPPCPLGEAWFAAAAETGPAATVAGEPVAVDAALARAAELLRGSRRPLLHGFEAATVEDARAAVALADRLGAIVTTGGIADEWPGAPAIPLRGASTATLGEIRDRSQLVVIWREDPEDTHPRLLDRLGFGGPPPRLAAERTLLVVDDRDTATARRADLRLGWAPDRDLEALTGLHALHRQLPLPLALALAPGDLTPELEGLLERVVAVPHVTFVYGSALSAGAGGQRRALALHELVRALSHTRHVVTLALTGAAGTTGADDALVWQSGYSGTVDFANGHPELVTATRPLAVAEGVDVSLRIEGTARELPPGVTEIALGGHQGWAGSNPEVAIRTAAAGVQATGTAHRLDGIPLALQAPRPSGAPTAAVLLARLLQEVVR